MASGGRNYGDEYYAHLNDSQTHYCTRLAALYYNAENGVHLSDLEPEDSQAFSCSWTAPGDNRRCYHVTFTATVGSGEERLYLGAWSTNNCMCCSGLWHPKERGSFDFGRK